MAIAEQQLREYAQNPPGRLRQRLGEFYAVPDVGLEEGRIQEWLLLLADHLKAAVENGDVPPPGPPRTHWEWHARFPELGQLLGGWYSQDMPDEFADHDDALADYLDSAHRTLIARLTGELHELLALDIDEADYALGLAELGLEVDAPAPFEPSAWLAYLADRISSPSAA